MDQGCSIVKKNVIPLYTNEENQYQMNHQVEKERRLNQIL